MEYKYKTKKQINRLSIINNLPRIGTVFNKIFFCTLKIYSQAYR